MPANPDSCATIDGNWSDSWYVICAAGAEAQVPRGGQDQHAETHSGESCHGFQMGRPLIGPDRGRGDHAAFTGAFAGTVAYDLNGQGRGARFSRFD